MFKYHQKTKKTAMQLYLKFQCNFLRQEYKFGYYYCRIQLPRKGNYLVLTILQPEQGVASLHKLVMHASFRLE